MFSAFFAMEDMVDVEINGCRCAALGMTGKILCETEGSRRAFSVSSALLG